MLFRIWNDRLRRLSRSALVVALLVMLGVEVVAEHAMNFPAALKAIESEAFAGDDSIGKVVVSDGVTSIGARAFANCKTLWCVVLPDSVQEIASDAFDGSGKVTIRADEQSYACAYAQANGIRFINSDGQIAGTDGAAIRYAFRDGVLTLSGAGAMISRSSAADYPWYCIHDLVEKVVVEEGVETIGTRAFNGCEALREVSLPESLYFVGRNAFSGASEALFVSGKRDSYAEEWAEGQNIPFRSTLELLSYPHSVTFVDNEAIALHVEAAGEALSYLWQIRADDEEPWSSIYSTYPTVEPSSLTDTLLQTLRAEMDGQQYRCIVTDAAGNSAVTEPITAVLRRELAIVEEPHSVKVRNGDRVTMQVEATGDGLSYRWQQRSLSGFDQDEWRDIDGATERVYTFYAYDDDTCYRCVIVDAYGGAVESTAAQVRFGVSLSDPQDVSVNAGETATFSVNVTGSDAKLQWQVCYAGEDVWRDISPTYGAQTRTLSIPTSAYSDGNQYRCAATDTDGTVETTRAAQLSVTVPVTGISLDSTSLRVSIGTIQTLSATVQPALASDKRVIWHSSNEQIVQVRDSGLFVAGTREGTAVVTATTLDGGYSATCAITVFNDLKLTDIRTSLAQAECGSTVGFTLDMSGGVQPYHLSGWLTNLESGATAWTVDRSSYSARLYDEVTLDSPGTYYLTARVTDANGKMVNGKSGFVTILRRATGLSLSSDTLSLKKDESHKLTATVLPADASDTEVHWNVLNPAVATCEDGLVVARGAGSTVINAESNSGSYTASCVVTVTVPVSSLNMKETAITLQKGQTHQLYAVAWPDCASDQSVSWSTMDPSVATVRDGLVTAVGKGTTKIVATSTDGGHTDSCTVTVEQGATGLVISREQLSVQVGKTAKLSALVVPEGVVDTAVTWTSSEPAVATVSGGTVTGVNMGSATITATTADGSFSASCAVTVYEAFRVSSIFRSASAVNIDSSDARFDFFVLGGVKPYSVKQLLYRQSDGALVSTLTTTTSEEEFTVNVTLNEEDSYYMTVQATDAEGSFATQTSAAIKAQASLRISSVTTSSTSVKADENFSVAATISGGTAPYRVRMELFNGDEVIGGKSFEGSGTRYVWDDISLTGSGTVRMRVTVTDAKDRTRTMDSPDIAVDKVRSSAIVTSVSQMSMLTGESRTFSVTIEPNNVSDRTVNVSVSDESVIRFDGGTMTVAALKAGEAQVVLEANDGGSRATIDVIVQDPVREDEPGAVKMSERGLQFIRDHEKLYLDVYDDGTGVWTIGYGHTSGVTRNTASITEEQANTYLLQDVANKSAWLDNFLRKHNISVSQKQYDAMADMCFNLRTNPFAEDCRLTRLLLEYRNDTSAIPADRVWECFATWHHVTLADNTKIDWVGLFKRRMNEARLFIYGNYERKWDWKTPSWLKDQQVGDEVPNRWVPEEEGGFEYEDEEQDWDGFSYNQGLLLLDETHYAYCFTRSTGSVDVYTNKYLNVQGTVDGGKNKNNYIDGATDELHVLGVGVTNGVHWAKVSYPITSSTTGQRHTAYIHLEEIICGTKDIAEYSEEEYYVCDRKDAEESTTHRVFVNDKVYRLAKVDDAYQILYPVSGGKYRIAWRRMPHEVGGDYNEALNLLNESRPAYCYALGNSQVYTYTANNLRKRGNVERGEYNAYIDPATDVLEIYNVGVTNGTAWAYVSYPAGQTRYHAYVPLSGIVYGSCNASHKSSIKYYVSDRPGEGVNTSHYVEPGDEVYLLAKNTSKGICQIMYKISSGAYRIAWCTIDEYNNVVPDPVPPGNLIFSYAGSSDSYAAFGVSGLSYSYDALQGNAERESALNAVLTEKGYTASSLANKKKMIVFLEGYGRSLDSNSKRSALCVVFSYGKVVFASDQASTLPDHPFDAAGNHTAEDSRSTDVGTLVDGTYTANAVNHKKRYPALNVSDAYAVRIHVGSTSNHDQGSKDKDAGLCKCPRLYGNDEMSLLHTGINIHRADNATTCSIGNIPDSAGCLNVYTDDYDMFAAAAGFAKVTSKSGIAKAPTTSTNNKVSCTVTVIVSRKYAYNHYSAARSFLQGKLTNGSTLHADALTAILDGSHTYAK